MHRWLLLHSPLLGPTSWGAVGRILARNGPVVIPSVRASGPPWARDQAEAATAGLHGSWVVVAHGGAGALVPLVGTLLDHVDRYVFLDASLPNPGDRSDTLPADVAARAVAGMVPPWSEWWPPGVLEDLLPDPIVRDAIVADCEPLPLGMFTEPMPAVEGWPDAPSTYIRLSALYDDELATAQANGWTTQSLDLGHLGLVTNPIEVYRALIA